MIYESIILNFVFTLLQRLKEAYYSSTAARIIGRIAAWGKRLFSQSAIWSFVKRPDYLTKVWESSALLRLLSFILNLPAKACRKLYTKFEESFLGSYIVRLLHIILERFEILIALFLLLMFAVPHASWKNPYSTAIVLLLTFLFFIRTVVKKSGGFDLKAVDMILLVFMLSVVLAAVTSIYPGDSLRYLLFYITAFLLVLIIVSSVRTGNSLGLMIDIALTGIAISGLYGLWQAKTGVAVDAALTDIELNEGMPGRIFSTMGNPNNYAEILILTLPFFLAVIFNAKSPLKKLVYLLLALPPLGALAFTGSRSGWIAFAAAMLVFVFLKNRKLIPLIIILGILCIPLLPDFVMRRIQTISNPNDTSAKYRTLIYQTVKPVLKDYWITGMGLGSGVFMRISQGYFQFTRAAVAHSHNLYLQTWLETGIIGIVTLIWGAARIVKKSMINIFNKTDTYINNILIAGVSAMAGISVMGLVEHVWFYPRVMLALWMVIGIILAGLRILNLKVDETISQKS